MKGVDAVIQSGGGAHAAADVLHNTSAVRRFSIFGRLVACMLLAGTLVFGLVPLPAVEQAVAAAAAANGALSITHSPVGGTFVKGNPVYLYSQAFSSAKNLLSYQWYRNTANSTSGGTKIAGATSANLVDDSAKSLGAGTYYYYVVVTDAKTGEKATSATAAAKIVDKGDIGDTLQNGNFEQGSTYWNTTHSPKSVEIRVANIYGLPAGGHGSACELAADQPSSIYQEIATVPGSVYRWGLDRGGRDGNEQAAMVVGPALSDPWTDTASGANAEFPYGQSISNRNRTYFNAIMNQVVKEQGLAGPQELSGKEFTTVYNGKTYYVYGTTGPYHAWATYSGSYTVPENQGLTVFAFVDSRSTASARGNVLDNISFQQGSPISASPDVDSQGNGILSATTKDGYAYGLLEVRGSTVTQVSNFQAKKGDAVLSEDTTVAAAGGQGWYVPGAGTISFANLTPGKTYRVVEVPVNAIGGLLGQNLTPSLVLDVNCYDDFSVKPVSGGDASSIGNIQVTAQSEDDGTSTLIVDPARDDVEYGVVAANAAGDGPADTVNVVKDWASSDTGRLTFTGLNPDTFYVVVGRPKGYEEIDYGPASASGTLIKTPPATFKDVKPADVARSEDGETITVTNNAGAAQEYMVYDVETKEVAGGQWYTLNPGESQGVTVPADKTYQVVTRSSGAVPAPGVRSYPAPTETLAIDYVNEVIPKGATMPKTLQYRAQDANNGETWRYGAADTWVDGTGGASVSLTNALDDMVALEEKEGVESTGATFWYRTAPTYEPAVALEKEIAVPARPEAPTQGTASDHAKAGFWIDYATDSLMVGGKDIQFRRAGASSWTRYAAGSSIGLTLLGWSEKDSFEFQIRTAAEQDNAFASEIVNVTVAARAEGPTSEGAPEVKGSKDGVDLRLENVIAGMQYREWGSGGAWTTINQGDIKTASDGTTRYVDVTTDGTYEVRMGATDDAPASFSVTASTTDSALSIKTLVRSFEQLNWGYSPSPERPITIKNTGTATAEIISVSLGNGLSSNFEVSDKTSGTVAAGATDETRKVSPVPGLAPGVYSDTVTVTYKSSTGSTTYTAAVPAYVQVRQAEQDAPRDVTATATDTSLTVTAKVPEGYKLADPTMEFSIDGGVTWSTRVSATKGEDGELSASTVFAGLDAATCYTVLVRMAADDLNYKLVSEETSGKFYTAKAAPADSKMTIDYVKETVSFPTGHEATSQAAGAGDAIERGGSVTDYLGAEATVFSLQQSAGTDLSKLTIPASSWTDVNIPARPSAPENVTASPADSSKASNGSITVTGATAVEYRKAGETVWIPAGGATAAGLAAGSYEVRFAATSSAFASMPASVTVEATKEVYATYLRNDGSEGDAAVFATQTVVPGNATTAPSPAPTRSNYQFAGWYESSDGGATLEATAFDFGATLSADVTLYAKWTANSYNLTFDTDGGSTAPEALEVSYDGKATEPAEPAKGGYSFAGWALSGRAEGNTELFDFSKSLADNFTAAGATPPQNNEAVSLVAQWTARSYSVSFDAATGDEADNPTAPGQVAFDAWITADKAAPKPEPTREGYSFDKWHLVKPDGMLVSEDYLFSQTLGDNLKSASLVPDGLDASFSVAARWTELEYTLSFDPAGGTPGSINQAEVKYTGKASVPTTVKRAGYTFDGWRLVTGVNAEGDPVLADVSFDFDASLADNLDAAGMSAPTANQELKVGLMAAWTANSYTVLFDADGDGAASEGEATAADVSFDAAVPDATTVPDAERAGWTFEHWKLSGAEDTVAFDPAATLSENFAAATLAPADEAVQVTLVPVFSENSYELFFDADGDGAYDASQGDTKVENIAYTAALENASAIAVPQKAGYTFGAWHLVNAEGGPLDAAFALDAAVQANFESASATPPKTTGATVRLVPSFVAKTYSVTFDLNGDGVVGDDEKTVAGVVFDAAAADSLLTEPTDPVRPGYLFQNWAIAGATGNATYDFALSLEENCTAFSFEPSTTATSVLLVPVWTPCGYSVTFDAQGGKPTPTGPEGTVLTNGTVTKPTGTDSQRPGYAFANWHLRTGGADEAPVLADVAYDFALTLEANFEAAGFDMAGGDDTKPAVPDDGAGVVLYASWTANEYTLLFDADSNGDADDDETTATVNSDGKATAPADPARPGYTFAGTWHLADRVGDSVATYDFDAPLIDNLAAAGFDVAAAGSGPAVPAAESQIALVPDWTENTYTLSFTANPTDDPDDLASTYPPDDIAITNPSDVGPVQFEAAAADVVMPQVSCTGYKFAGWRFASATDRNARYDTTLSLKANLAAAGFDVGELDETGAPVGGAALPAGGGKLELEAVWTKIPIKVEIPLTLTAQIGFDKEHPDVRTVTVNPDLDPNDDQPAPELSIVSWTEAPLRLESVEVSAGDGLATLFPKGLYQGDDAVTMSINGVSIFNGKTLADGGVDTLLPQTTELPKKAEFFLSAFPGYGSPSVKNPSFGLVAPMSIPMAQITDPSAAASFLKVAYTFVIVDSIPTEGGE